MNAMDNPEEREPESAGSDDREGKPILLGRKSVLMGMAASMGVALANATQPSSAMAAVPFGTVKPIAASQPPYAPKWTPSTAYALGQQVISPNDDVVSANAAHRSSTNFTSDQAKWTLSSTFVKRSEAAPLSNTAPQQLGPVALAGTAPTAMRSDAVLALPAGASSPYGVFGDGASGALFFDGVGAVAGYNLVGSVYTCKPDDGFDNPPTYPHGAAHLILATDVTVASGVTVRMTGFPLFATGLLTNNGVIETEVNNAVADLTGAGTAAGYMQTLMSSRTGQDGATGVGTVNKNWGEDQAGSFSHGGGNGGPGGLGSAGAGGNPGGTPSSPHLRALLHSAPTCFQPSTIAIYDGNTTGSNGMFMVLGGVYGGIAGGSGAGDGTNKGGAGGPSGGVLAIHARHLRGSGIFRALGGNGGDGVRGNCGGGGGGGGGVVIVNTTSTDGWTGTLQASGGTGGAKSGTGVAGTAGYSGFVTLNVFS